MRVGFSTYFFVKKPVGDVLKEIISSGVKTIELSFEIPGVLQMDDGFIEKTEKLKEEEGVEFSMHAPFFEINLGSFFQKHREYSKERLFEAIAVASRIGCNPVVVHPGFFLLTGRVKELEEKTKGYFLDDLEEIYVYGKERGVDVTLENVYIPVFFFSRFEQFDEIKRRIPSIGITLDVGHAYIAACMRGEKEPEEAIIRDIKQIGLDHIHHVHLHNNMGMRDDHLFLGGRMDLKKVLKGLYRMGYEKKVIIESYEMEDMGIDRVLTRLAEISPGG
ncbi:MAG: sugar phosphate isomerase/epimerase [Syntrophorhabdaceae bacterium]|nr:sugar phosphate isomerase/epimerase [Syntrophorhabdaceae bacterium]